jgi:23S rRNA (uracil1939-C5)-methyltransferase
MFDHRSLVESDVPAVNAADFALQEAGLATELWKGPAEEFLPAEDGPLANIDLDKTVAVIDPPRMGCLQQVVNALRKRPPKYLIYVSCNPATLARDLKLLCADSLYTPEKCALFDMFPRTAHFETVVLLSKGEVDSKKIRVEFSLEDMDMSEFQDGATYTQIKDYVLEHSGLKVSNLYISQIKRKCGIEVGKNYNLPKSEDSRQPLCPPEKEKAIREAFKYFGII